MAALAPCRAVASPNVIPASTSCTKTTIATIARTAEFTNVEYSQWATLVPMGPTTGVVTASIARQPGQTAVDDGATVLSDSFSGRSVR